MCLDLWTVAPLLFLLGRVHHYTISLLYSLVEIRAPVTLKLLVMSLSSFQLHGGSCTCSVWGSLVGKLKADQTIPDARLQELLLWSCTTTS